MDLGLWSHNQDRRVGTTGLVGAVRRYGQRWRRVHIPADSLQFIDGSAAAVGPRAGMCTGGRPAPRSSTPAPQPGNPFSLRWVLVPCVFDTREANCAGAAEDSRLGSTSRCGLQSDQGVC